jgi:hypothetical protein
MMLVRDGGGREQKRVSARGGREQKRVATAAHLIGHGSERFDQKQKRVERRS